jgi:hypothetical protein
LIIFSCGMCGLDGYIMVLIQRIIYKSKSAFSRPGIEAEWGLGNKVGWR